MAYVLVCGDREWQDEAMIRERLVEHLKPGDVVLHGDCRGADRLAGKVAQELGYRVEAAPADWKRFGNRAGPIRNREMALLKPRLVLAFHDDLSRSRGTADMVRLATAAKIPVWVCGHSDMF